MPLRVRAASRANLGLLAVQASAELRAAWTAEGGRPYANLGRGEATSPHKHGSRLLFASFWALGGGGCLRMMTDIGSENPENYVFGNVGGVVGDAF